MEQRVSSQRAPADGGTGLTHVKRDLPSLSADVLTDRARRAVSEQDVLSLAQTLVRIPTENPPGTTDDACRALASAIEPSGFQVEYFEAAEGATSLIATFEFPTPGRTLLLNGHLDVVPVGPSGNEWKHDPWGGEVVDGRLYGRGSLDMKGPLAALVVAARAVAEAGLPLAGKLQIAAVADEEQGGDLGAGALVAAGKIAADGALVAEPGDGGVVIAHRGFCFVRLRTRGRAAHASMPERGLSAVELMIDLLVACRSLRLRHVRHPLLGEPSVAIGTTISGGTKINVIPDSCEATLDVRTVPEMKPEQVLADIQAHLRAHTRAGVEPPEVELVRLCEPAESAADSTIVQVAAAAFEREFARKPRLQGMPAGTDARWFVNELGIPTVAGLAPGRIEECHVIDESIDVDELARYARVYADVIVNFLAEEVDNSYADDSAAELGADTHGS
jgi:succinyl-diaminopimelate desuccinylase